MPNKAHETEAFFINFDANKNTYNTWYNNIIYIQVNGFNTAKINPLNGCISVASECF